MSNDGRAILFGRKAAGELMVWTAEGGVRTIATLTGSKFVTSVRMLAGERGFVFAAQLSMPGLPNPDGDLQLFRFGVDDAQPLCVSCPPDGSDPSGWALPGSASGLGYQVGISEGVAEQLRGNRVVSEDGRRIFFDTPDPLDPRDSNGARDVYVWEDGVAHLISSGQNGLPTFLLDASASGNDIFFATAQGLDPRDTDGQFDVYDARVNGGFAIEAKPTECFGDGCQVSEGGAPSALRPGSAAIAGPGNLQARSAKGRKHARALKACRKKTGKSRKKCESQTKKRFRVATNHRGAK